MTKNIHAICEECNEAVTNPICPSCLEREAVIWLSEIGKENFIAKVNEKMAPLKSKKGEDSLEEEINCIICGKSLTVCPHCASKKLMEAFRNDKKLLGMFLTYFGYVY